MKIAIRDDFATFDAKVTAILDFSQNSKNRLHSALRIHKMQLCTMFQKAIANLMALWNMCSMDAQ